MNYLNPEKAERIESMWEIANKIIEKDGDIHAPIVIISFHDDENFAMLNGCNYNTKDEFREAIHSAVATVEASSAMMIASAKATNKDIEAEDGEEANYNEIVLLAYKSKEADIQQVAKVETDDEGGKTIGKVTNYKGLINNTFFDGLFDTMH